jgi:hypothetical protein
VEINFQNAVIGLIGTIVIAFTSYFGIVRKSRADETQIALSAWKELIEPLKLELIQTKEEVIKLRAALEAAENSHSKETGRLMKRIRELEQANRDRV